MGQSLPPIPVKRYFTISETGVLCAVKPHVLRYWEQEFTQLRPMKRAGNRRYYQHHEVLMIRKIRSLLYDKGFTISGARNQLQELGSADQWASVLATEEGLSVVNDLAPPERAAFEEELTLAPLDAVPSAVDAAIDELPTAQRDTVRKELREILRLLAVD
jgi:DNA-binding transcriptional MerR regulator